VSDLIIREQPADCITLLRLNRPDALNAFNVALLAELERHIDGLATQADLRAVIITGVGKAFCAGGDLKALQNFDPQQAQHFALTGHRVMQKVEACGCPVIAAVNGYAFGGGGELALACDLRYAARGAKLGFPESKVGMITGWGGTFRLPRYVGIAKAKEMIFTGSILNADEANTFGLVNAVFEPEDLLDQVLAVAREIAANAPVANRLSKRMLNRYAGDPQAMAHEEALALSLCMATHDQREAIQAFYEKRSPVFTNS
jgi:enoyl-CoA hydratase